MSRPSRLSIGYGQEWQTVKRRVRWFWIVAVGSNVVVAAGAMLAWASVVTRELPVITLMPEDTGVCAQWRPLVVDEWSDVQVRSWIRTLTTAAMVQDSRLVSEKLQAVTAMLSPALRAEFRRTEAIRARFAQMQALQVRGEIIESEFVIRCGENPRFLRGTAPWLCTAHGGITYWPARHLKIEAAPVTSYFFIELAIAPGEISMANPLGLEAVEFHPREAVTKEDLQRLVAEEKL